MYKLQTLKTGFDQVVDFSKYREDYYLYFVQGHKEGIKSEYFNLVLEAQSGFSSEQLESLDYIQCSSPIPIFSKKFVVLFEEQFKGVMEFHPCIIKYEHRDYNFFMGDIQNKENIINESLSGVFTLSDGSSMIDEPVVYFNIDYPFVILRDSTWMSSYIVSEVFKCFVEKNNLKMECELIKNRFRSDTE